MTITEQPTKTSDVTVRLDDRVRLISALLAATDYPDKAQQVKPHGTHAHARATRKHLNDHGKHPAVMITQAMLDKHVPLEALYTAALHLDPRTLKPAKPMPTWLPKDWDTYLRDFLVKAGLQAFWQQENFVWDKAYTESQHVFRDVSYKRYLSPYFDDIPESFVFIPNIAYPSHRELGLRFDGEMICIAPPPLAWGDSPPWPYDEETMLMHAYRAALGQYGRILLTGLLRQNPERVAAASETDLPVNDQFKAQFPTWEEQLVELFVTALVAIYLEEKISEAEYKAFVLMERKVRGMNILPGTVSVMRRYLQERGNKFNTFIEFLPLFPKQLRVAKRIVNL